MAKTQLKLESTTHQNHTNKVPPYQYYPEIKMYRFLVKDVAPYVLDLCVPGRIMDRMPVISARVWLLEGRGAGVW